MKNLKQLLCLAISVYVFGGSKACDLVGGTVIGVPISAPVIDVFRGAFFERETFDVISITSTTTSSTNYVSVTHEDSTLRLSTADAFEQYEEVEVDIVFGVTVNLNCVGGQTRTLIFQITVTDTNNNDPIFLPNSEYEFTVTPPLPQNFAITGCLDEIIVRDIDLTTSSIDFAILDDNEYFQIDYDERGDTKEFKARLETKTFVRTLPEPVTLRISATDVDSTGDPRRTVFGTIRINSNEPFMPEDLIFSETYYLGNYNSDSHEVSLENTISLTRGYDDEVQFVLESDYENYFNIIPNGNSITLDVQLQLPSDVVRIENQILLVIRAQRELVEDATATIILQLPEEIPLLFEKAHYEGTLENSELNLPALILTQGYQDTNIAVRIENEHNSSFSYTLEENAIIITMTALNQNIIDENSFLTLQVVASTDRSTAIAVVSLEIIKDDTTTPVFEKSLYSGNYNTETGLDLEQIVIAQGYDSTVTVTLEDNNNWFVLEENGATLTLTASDIPSEVFVEQKLLLTLRASKPRTVGATTIVSIDLPQVRELSFEAPSYMGALQDDQQFTHENIFLNVGYGDDVNFTLSGDLSNYFSVSNTQDQVFINLLSSLPVSAILENNFLSLTVNAIGFHSTQARTVILIEVVKEDVSTPVFAQDIYYGRYLLSNGIEMEAISLRQGYDGSVTFGLEGENSDYFDFSQYENSITLSLKSEIPEEVIFREKVMVFSIVATKTLTVGGRATIHIEFPEELTNLAIMTFSQNTYVGVLEQNDLSLETITLESGYNENTFFNLSGEYEQHFELTNVNNIPTIALRENFPVGSFENVTFIILEIEASRNRAISVSSSIIIEIKQEEKLQPIFAKAYYTGVYNGDQLQFDEDIRLSQGYADSVEFSLDEESSSWFYLVLNGESLSLTVNELPADILENNDYLIFSISATKPNFEPISTAIVIDLPKDTKTLAFEMHNYLGTLQNDSLIFQNVILTSFDETIPFTTVTLQGDLEEYFLASVENEAVTITLINEIPEELLLNNNLIVLTLQAASLGYISAYSTIIIEVQKEDVTSIVNDLEFSELYYVGQYSDTNGLTFSDDITLTEGYTEEVEFDLSGDNSQWFGFTPSGNLVTIQLTQSIPEEIMVNNHQLVFFVIALKPGSIIARTTIVISLSEDIKTLAFEMNNYVGTLQNDLLVLQNMILISSDTTIPSTTVRLQGDLEEYFVASTENEAVTITLINEIPEELLPNNNIIILTVQASSLEYISAYSTIIIEVQKESVTSIVNDLEFSELYYVGNYSNTNGLAFSDDITLVEGYTDEVEFNLSGDDSQWFSFTPSGNLVTIQLTDSIPEEIILNNRQIIFFVTASKPGSILARTIIVISLLADTLETKTLGFEQVNYVGTINNTEISLPIIVLSEGYSNDVTFALFGEMSYFFNVTQGLTVTIHLNPDVQEEFPTDVYTVILELQATAPEYVPAHATVVLEIIKQPSLEVISFEEVYYTGIYLENELSFTKSISLYIGYNNDVQFDLVGEQSTYFGLLIDGNSAQLFILEPIPPVIIATNQKFIFSVRAQHPNSHEAYATIIISLTDEYEESLLLGFEKINYVGNLIENANVVIEPIVLGQGFSDSVTFALYGVMSDYFTVTQGSANPSILLRTALPQEFISANGVVILNLEASSPPSMPAHTTIIIEIIMEETNEHLIYFSETYYIGSYDNSDGLIFHNDIILSEGYDENVSFELDGDDSEWFTVNQVGNTAAIDLDGELPLEILTNRMQLIFIIKAKKEVVVARATIIITLRTSNTNMHLRFEEVNYLGTIEEDVLELESIVLQEGYSEHVEFSLNGDFSNNFNVSWTREIVTITLKESLPIESIPANRLLIYDLMASAPDIHPAYTTVIFKLILNGNQPDIYFDKVIYEGRLEGDTMQHEIITLVGYSGEVEVLGDHGSLFVATVSSNEVRVEKLEGIDFPTDQSILVLELKAATAGAVLVLQVEQTETPTLPTVSFGSEVYALSVDVEQTGLLGRVTATASNSETLTYELILDNEHLQQRLSINNDGDIHMSAPANPGAYSFQIQATTVVTKATSTAMAHLTVTAITVCANDNKVVPPLIIIDRDEESPHHSLVPLNTEEWPGCQYIMNNRWPLDQSWLYVDENGLHTTAIDREDSSIALMALSQIQIELILQCNDDSSTRRKRSLQSEFRNYWLGPYDYGTNKWILTDTIHFNSRRSFVNLIVNDINDNAPIFVGKENEPLAVGYPVSSLEGVILPRALAELEATDADIGENAVILYWSEESVLAVSPTTGSIHVRVGEHLENDMRLIVQATDRFGDGLTGTIQLLVKLVDSRHIAVVTVRDAFLDDEKTILDDLSKSVGYEVKALRSMITSDETQSDEDEDETRVKRQVNDAGSSLVLYIYGLIEREPVSVEKLTMNITEVSSAVNIVRTVSLEDHLASDQICVISARETALLVTTIVLSVLLFMLIAAIAFSFFLKWWRNRNYNEFTDESSIHSDKDTVVEVVKHEIPKPRLNTDDLKRSERRLQEMLDAPIEQINADPVTPVVLEPKDLMIEIPTTPISTAPTPIVIQSFDKLKDDDSDGDYDEFGEVKKPARRKSVVTFNENVEKIIHLEDEPSGDDESIEIYKL